MVNKERCADCWSESTVLVVVRVAGNRRQLRCLEHVHAPDPVRAR